MACDTTETSQRRSSVWLTAAAVVLCLPVFTAASAGAEAHVTAAAHAASGGTWGTAQEVAAGLNTGGNALITSVSCASPGNCSAGGYYASSRTQDQAFAVAETGGTWGSAHEVAAALNTGGEARIISVSCASPGNCSAGGFYSVGGGARRAFVVGETDGIWGTAQEAAAALNRGGGAQVSSVSCASAGNCTAGGYYTGHAGDQHAFVVTEANGTWGTAAKVLGTMPAKHLISAVTSVSCTSPGNCSAAGYAPGSAGLGQAFVVAETNGSWGRAQDVPGVTAPSQASIFSVSCASVGNCSAGGQYRAHGKEQAFVIGES
jgi:hypothetical protein